MTNSENLTLADVKAGLEGAQYLPDEGLVSAVYLAMTLRRPLLLEGEAGVGKTEVAKALSAWRGGELIRLQCYEGITVSQAVYEWDYAKQILSLRAAQGGNGADTSSTANATSDLYSEEFLVRRPLLQAVSNSTTTAPILLIDEVDRADDEFEAYLLEVLSDWSITVPEIGTFKAKEAPIAVITSNRTRDIHDALRRRCLYHWVEHPSLEREAAIVALRSVAGKSLSRQVAQASGKLRDGNYYKPPSVAESIAWADALHSLGVEDLDTESAERTLGAVLKYREDQERARAGGLKEVTKEVSENV